MNWGSELYLLVLPAALRDVNVLLDRERSEVIASSSGGQDDSTPFNTDTHNSIADVNVKSDSGRSEVSGDGL